MIHCIIAGVGGQGTLLTSKILAEVALFQGKQVRTAETIGMAQRGGSVVSHVRFGRGEIYSPQIPPGSGDVLLAFEICEGVRHLSSLKKDAVIVVNRRLIIPYTATLSRQHFEEEEMLRCLCRHSHRVIPVEGDALCQELGSTKVLNTLLLGVAIGTGALDMTLEEVKQVLKEKGKASYRELNLRALERGEKCSKK